MANVGVSRSRGLKLFGREIILEESNLRDRGPERHRQTDGQYTIAILRFALKCIAR